MNILNLQCFDLVKTQVENIEGWTNTKVNEEVGRYKRSNSGIKRKNRFLSMKSPLRTPTKPGITHLYEKYFALLRNLLLKSEYVG